MGFVPGGRGDVTKSKLYTQNDIKLRLRECSQLVGQNVTCCITAYLL